MEGSGVGDASGDAALTEGVWICGGADSGSVGGLFEPGCPTAVVGRVAFGIVDAFEGEAGGRVSEIIDEVGEAFGPKPSVADGDAFGVIMGVGRVRGAGGSSDHGFPFVEGGSFSALDGAGVFAFDVAERATAFGFGRFDGGVIHGVTVY